MDTGNTSKKLLKFGRVVCELREWTNRQTGMLITIPHTPSGGEVNLQLKYKILMKLCSV